VFIALGDAERAWADAALSDEDSMLSVLREVPA
jgi:hypothetical protein